MKFAVVAQSAGSTGLDQNIGALLQGFNITTHHTFERCTDEVRAVFCTKFNGSFCHGRWSQIFQMQTVIYKVLDWNVIVSKLRVTEFIFLFRHYRRASFRKRIISIKLSRRVSIPAFPS